MNFQESLDLSWSKHGGHDLPWEVSKEAYTVIFQQGWHAHAEAIKQTDLFPGTWDKDNLRPASLTGQNAALVAPSNPFKSDAGLDQPSFGGGKPLVTAEEIYAAYPRKVGRAAAIKAINKVPSKWRDGGFAMRKFLLERTQSYAAAVAKWPAADKQFIPHPATWFNRGSYDDDPKEWSRGAATTSQFSKTH